MTEYEIYKYQAYRKGIREDKRPVEDGWIMEDRELLGKYLTAIRAGKPNLFEHVSEEKLMELMRITKHEKPTLGSFLIFSQYPQTVFPNLCITAVVIPGTERGDSCENGLRFLDNRRISGSLSSMLEETVNFIERNMRRRTVITENGRRADEPEYPLRAVREAVLNALIHRDYSRMTESSPIRIEMYNDRLEILNPGGIYGRINVEALGLDSPETRNSTITSILEILGISENRYSGIPTMRAEMKKLHLPEPEFIDTGSAFKVILRNQRQDQPEEHLPEAGQISQREQTILDFCVVPHTRKEIAEYLGLSYAYVTNKLIRSMIDKNLLVPANSSERNQKLLAFNAAQTAA